MSHSSDDQYDPSKFIGKTIKSVARRSVEGPDGDLLAFDFTFTDGSKLSMITSATHGFLYGNPPA